MLFEGELMVPEEFQKFSLRLSVQVWWGVGQWGEKLVISLHVAIIIAGSGCWLLG
jgi:hypothetical protein